MTSDGSATPPITAVVFGVLGTLLDEDRGRTDAVRSALPELAEDAGAVAADWRDRVSRAMSAIAAGEQPFHAPDELEQAALGAALDARGRRLSQQRIAEIARFGHRLAPFPDVPAALGELRARLPVVALTNAGLGQAAAMFTHVGWEWTAVVSAESMATYEPDPRMYRHALEVLGPPAERVLLVAAHPWALDAAAGQGLRTGHLHRGAGTERDRFDLAGPDLPTLVRAILG